MECRSIDDVCALGRDNFTVGGHWILTDGYKVSVVAQKVGASPTESISIDRATFNRLVRWYMRQQVVRKQP